MLKGLFAIVSYALHHRATASKQLDVVIDEVKRYEKGDVHNGMEFSEPVYVLSLTCAETPRKTFSHGGYTQAIEGFDALAGVADFRPEILAQLTPGTAIAVKGELCKDGTAWAYHITHGGLGVQTYYLADIQIGKADNPVNASEVLMGLFFYPADRLQNHNRPV